MLIAWGLFVIGVILSVYFVWWGRANRTMTDYRYVPNHWEWREVCVLVCAVSIVATVISGGIAAANTFIPMYSERVCYRWGRDAEREVKFIHESFWSWGCYLHTDEGWTLKDKNIKVDD